MAKLALVTLGKYAFIEASDNFGARRLRGDIARLISSAVLLPRACLTMDYHMYGRDMGALKIKIKSHRKEKIIWQKSGNQGNQWKKLETSIESIKKYSVSPFNVLNNNNNYKANLYKGVYTSTCTALINVCPD